MNRRCRVPGEIEPLQPIGTVPLRGILAGVHGYTVLVYYPTGVSNNGTAGRWPVIQVKHSSGGEWVVTIKASVTTDHRVRVTQQDLERLSAGQPAEALLEESFRFLLEREPNTSILPSFPLPLIGRYFPEYEREVQTRLQRKG